MTAIFIHTESKREGIPIPVESAYECLVINATWGGRSGDRIPGMVVVSGILVGVVIAQDSCQDVDLVLFAK